MKLAVIGTGYVGLVTGACFAETGNDVTCVDIDPAKIERLLRGEVPFFEPGLSEIVAQNIREGRLKFTTRIQEAVPGAQVVFIAVGTPQDEDGSADLQYVLAAARDIGRNINGYTLVVTKSTVPVGTGAKVKAALLEVGAKEFEVVSNPEFLKEGAAVNDFQKPDRVVVGCESQRARDIMGRLYAPFVRNENPIIFMDIPSAEMTKYASNCLLAARISLINEIANLCEAAGADVDLVRKGAGADKRIGYAFLYPGVGYGGSCFPKDVRALVSTAREHGVTMDILEAADRVNQRQKQRLFQKLRTCFGGSLSGRTIAVWGIAFKPKTDDIREAPSVELMKALLDAGASIRAHDPEAMDNARRLFGDRVKFTDNNYDALSGADALVIVTEWNEFRQPDFERMKKLLKRPLIVDGRNLYSLDAMAQAGFEYHAIGRPPVPAGK
ncbi:MAG: UDP-glucose 6-dehydrogenase [Myxococcota bacterium]|nr:UDP-glucose 6-dehydrogenase [Myxococcota bacterium]